MPNLNLGKTETTKEEKKKTAGDLDKIVQAARDFQEAADTIADELVRGAKTIDELPEKTAAMVRRFWRLVFVIENGEIRTGDELEMEKKNEFYRIKSLVSNVFIIDYDKTKIRPFVKDILNRAGNFIEIKMLWQVLIISIITFVFALLSWWNSGKSPDEIAKSKSEILMRIDTACSWIPSRKGPIPEASTAPAATLNQLMPRKAVGAPSSTGSQDYEIQ